MSNKDEIRAALNLRHAKPIQLWEQCAQQAGLQVQRLEENLDAPIKFMDRGLVSGAPDVVAYLLSGPVEKFRMLVEEAQTKYYLAQREQETPLYDICYTEDALHQQSRTMKTGYLVAWLYPTDEHFY